MIITVKAAEMLPIEGLASKAAVQRSGDTATLTILASDFTGARRAVGRTIAMLGERWAVTGQDSASQVQTLTCRRITDG